MDSLNIIDIDAKIPALQAETGTLTHQRNTLVPIETLPTEVLCTIFVFVKLACKSLHIRGECRLLEWVKVTHVCRWWREAGIQACDLWNEVPLHCVKWGTEILARSKGAPLIVTGSTKSLCEDHGFLPLEPFQFARIHELNIQCFYHAPLQSIWKVCSVPEKPLLLHTVRLQLSPSMLKDFHIFPDALGELESHLPLLRRLVLTRCGINWNAPFICNLTHLRLSGPEHFNANCYKINSLLEALKTMPMLETLAIENLSRALDSELSTARNIPVFALPNLKFLAMTAEIDCVGILMHAVSLPSILATCIDGYRCRLPTSTHPLVFSLLSAPPHRDPIRTLEIIQESGLSRIRSWSVALSQGDVSTLRVIPAMQTIYRRWAGTEIQELSFIFNQISFENLVSLSLPRTPPMDAPTWARTFGTLSALEFINVNGKNAQSLFEALVYGGHELTKSTIPFPSLLSISIKDVKPVCPENEEPDSAFQDSLIGALIERYELGREVREIIFVYPSSHWNEFFLRIREVVVDVEVVKRKLWKQRRRPTSSTRMDSSCVDSVANMSNWMGFWV